MTEQQHWHQPAPEQPGELLHLAELPENPDEPGQQDTPESQKTQGHVGGSAALSRILDTTGMRTRVAMTASERTVHRIGTIQGHPCVFRKVDSGKAEVVLVIHVDKIIAASKTAEVTEESVAEEKS